MKRSIIRVIFKSTVVALISSSVWATHIPIDPNQNRSSWVAGIQDLNIQIVNPLNASGTEFYFMASDNGSEPLNTNQASDLSLGHRIAGTAIHYLGTGGAQTLGKDIFPVRLGDGYFIYVETCDQGTPYTLGAINTSVCSNWVLINGGSISTLGATTDPGFKTISKANVTSPSSINVALNNPIISDNSAQNWILNITQSGVPGNTSGDLPNPFSPGSGPYALTVNDSYFVTQGTAFRLSPNTAYILNESILYNYSQQTTPTAPATSPFWTNPVDPANVTVTPTHFTATINFNSHGAGLDNPVNTVYRVTAVQQNGPDTHTFDVTYTGTNPMSHKFTGLVASAAGTPYTACVTAQNLGGGSWNPSTQVCQNFTTLPLNPTYSVSGVQTNQATFNVTLNPPTGITDYLVERCVGGVNGTCVQDVKTAWPGVTQTINDTMSGLTPNTAYEFYVELFEGADNSAFMPQPDLGVGVNQFTTTPTDPSLFNLTNAPPVADTLHASWTVGPGNPGATHNEVQYCTDAACSVGCLTLDVPGNGATKDITSLLEETSYSAHVRALSVGGGE